MGQIINHKCSYKYRSIWHDYREEGQEMVSYLKKEAYCDCGKSYLVASPSREQKRYRIHGKMSLASIAHNEPEIICNLSKNILKALQRGDNRHKWKTIEKQLLQTDTMENIDQALVALYNTGVILKHEFRVGKGVIRKSIYKLEYLPNYMEEIRGFLGEPKIKQLQMPDLTELELIMKKIPRTEEGESLQKILGKQLEGFQQSGRSKLTTDNGRVVASFQPGRKEKYLRLLKALIQLYQIVENRERVKYKTFSSRVTNDTKGFSRSDRKALEAILNSDLQDFGVYNRAPRCLAMGSFSWSLDGKVMGHCRAFLPYATFTEEMLEVMGDLTLGNNVKYCLVVENEELFEELLIRAYLGRDDCVVLCSDGYLSGVQLKLINKLIEAGIKKFLVWSDPDPFGIEIYYDIKKKLNLIGVGVNPVGLSLNLFNKIPQLKEMGDRDVKKAEALLDLIEEIEIKMLLKVMVEKRKKGEQECLLDVLSDGELMGLVAWNYPNTYHRNYFNPDHNTF